MKKLLIGVALICVAFASSAQIKANLGVSFTGNSTWMFNKYSSNIPDLKYRASWGTSWGIVTGIEFMRIVAIEVDFNFNTINQKYKGSNFMDSYNSDIRLKTLDIPVLLRLGNLVYVEAGPIIQFINKAEFTAEYGDNISGFPAKGSYSVIDSYNKSNFGAAVGFGVNVPILPRIRINAGIRLNYIFTDMKGVDAIGLPKVEGVNYSDNFSTHALYGGLKLGLVFRL